MKPEQPENVPPAPRLVRGAFVLHAPRSFGLSSNCGAAFNPTERIQDDHHAMRMITAAVTVALLGANWWDQSFNDGHWARAVELTLVSVRQTLGV